MLLCVGWPGLDAPLIQFAFNPLYFTLGCRCPQHGRLGSSQVEQPPVRAFSCLCRFCAPSAFPPRGSPCTGPVLGRPVRCAGFDFDSLLLLLFLPAAGGFVLPVGCQKRHAETLSPFPLGSASPSCRPGHSLPPETVPWVCLFRRRLLFPVSHSASLVTGASRRLGGVGGRLVCEGGVRSRRGPSRAWRPCSGAVGSRSLLRASFSALTFLPSCPLCPFWTPSPGPALAPIWWLLWCVASVLLWPPLQICHRQRLPFS